MSSTRILGRPPGFPYRSAKLHCEGVALEKLAARFGTPLYVYSATTIQQRLRSFDAAFGRSPHTVCYSVKANSNISILRMLSRMGCGFDVVSGGELERVLVANRKAAGKVVFSGVGKTAEEISLALQAGILLFNVESESELLVLADCARRLKKRAPVALRVNPDVSAETHPYISTGLHQHKFGVPMQQARELYGRAAGFASLQVKGVSVHIGSQITDPKPFSEAMERVAELVRQLRSIGLAIEYVDAGGGLGIPYDGELAKDFPARARGYAQALLTPLRRLNVHLLLEPGRSVVGPAGALLTRVLYMKSNQEKQFLIVDAAMNDLIRPSLYKAHHEIIPVVSARGAQMATVDVVGPICETGDFFARDRNLPEVQENDLLAILDAGAYGMALASNYNTRGRPAEVLVEGNKTRLIRKRESVKDLLRAETSLS